MDSRQDRPQGGGSAWTRPAQNRTRPTPAGPPAARRFGGTRAAAHRRSEGRTPQGEAPAARRYAVRHTCARLRRATLTAVHRLAGHSAGHGPARRPAVTTRRRDHQAP